MDLAKVVTTDKPYEWSVGSWQLGKGHAAWITRVSTSWPTTTVKRNILRMIADRGARVTVVPAQMPAREVLRMKPDGVLPRQRPRRSGAVRLRHRGDRRDPRRHCIPVFGICLGHQLMGLASGAKTKK